MAKKKRKPRAKRKQVIPSQSNEIPYSKYRIEWMDILSDSGWATDKEFHRMKLAFPVNEGWLFSKDRYTILSIASYDKDEDTKELTFGDRTMIPLACVKKMTKIK
jgi:hypothetical protein